MLHRRQMILFRRGICEQDTLKSTVRGSQNKQNCLRHVPLNLSKKKKRYPQCKIICVTLSIGLLFRFVCSIFLPYLSSRWAFQRLRDCQWSVYTWGRRHAKVRCRHIQDICRELRRNSYEIHQAWTRGYVKEITCFLFICTSLCPTDCDP
jgi:hypothetical protein